MLYILYFLHVIVCFFLILVVLLQQGKGADLSVFGGGGTMTAFGARGAATVLHKMTVISFVLFIFTTLAIGIMQGNLAETTVMEGVAIEEEVGTEDAEPEPASAFGTDAADGDGTAGTAAETAEPSVDDAVETPLETEAPVEAPPAEEPPAEAPAEDGADG